MVDTGEGRIPGFNHVRITPSVLIDPMSLFDLESPSADASRRRGKAETLSPIATGFIRLIQRSASRSLRRHETVVAGGESIWLMIDLESDLAD